MIKEGNYTNEVIKLNYVDCKVNFIFRSAETLLRNCLKDGHLEVCCWVAVDFSLALLTSENSVIIMVQNCIVLNQNPPPLIYNQYEIHDQLQIQALGKQI